jgi:hypothetical protein
MAESSANLYKKSLDKAFSQVGLNPGTMSDHAKYSQSMKEDKSEDTPMIKRSINKFLHAKKKETKEQENEFSEEWSEKYKKSIDCSHPKGFSQKAHCAGRKKKETKEATGSGSSGAFVGPVFGGDDEFWERSRSENPKLTESEELKLIKSNKDMVYGVIHIVKKVKDMSNRRAIANDMVKKFKEENIKMDYDKFLEMCGLPKEKKSENKEGFDSIEEQIEKVEAKEATTSGSVGGYESPSMWAKSTKKKDWGPSRKTQIPGGGFVKIKKKCTKFPYCNQGDINNVKISKNESVKEAIKNVSKNTGVSENVIKTILEHEYEKINKRHK